MYGSKLFMYDSEAGIVWFTTTYSMPSPTLSVCGVYHLSYSKAGFLLL